MPPTTTILYPDDRAALRRSARLTQRLLHHLYAADAEALRRGLRDLAKELLPLHRRLEPARYSRKAGARP